MAELLKTTYINILRMNISCPKEILMIILTLSLVINVQSIPEARLCDSTISRNNTVTLMDSAGNSDCTCKIKRNATIKVSFTVSNFTCDFNTNPWKLKLWVDGCEHSNLGCQTDWTDKAEFTVLKSGNASDIILHIFKYLPQSQAVYYNIGIMADNEIEIECGLDAAQTIVAKTYQECLAQQLQRTTSQQNTSLSLQTLSYTTVETTTSEFGAQEEIPAKMGIGTMIGLIAGGVVILILTIIIIVIVFCQRKKDSRRKLVEKDQDNQSQYSYTHELPGIATDKQSNISKSKPHNELNVLQKRQIEPNNAKDLPESRTKTLPGSSIYVTDSWWDEKQKQKAETLPLKDTYLKPNKNENLKPNAQNLNRTSAEGEGNYSYFNRIVDDEFSFIHNDLYSGHLGV